MGSGGLGSGGLLWVLVAAIISARCVVPVILGFLFSAVRLIATVLGVEIFRDSLRGICQVSNVVRLRSATV
jgi:hypothetical protein